MENLVDRANTAWKVSKYGVISGPYFPQSEYRKIRTRNNSVFGHFSRSDTAIYVFNFLTQHAREEILREIYISIGVLTGCLRQLQLKFDRWQNIIFHIPLNKFRANTAFFLHSLLSSSFFGVKTEKTTINLSCFTELGYILNLKFESVS